MTIQGSYNFMSLSQMFRERDTFDFDHTVQREGDLWKQQDKSLFIHSLIYGYPYPPVYAINQNGKLSFLDGKQRLNTCFEYKLDGFALSKNTPDVDGRKIAGKKFSELPEYFKEKINSSMFQVYQYSNLTDEEVRELFLRLNNGKSLTHYEKVRAWTPAGLADRLARIKAMPFFAESLPDKTRQRYGDEHIILQVILLLQNDGEATDLYTKRIKSLLTELSENEVSEDTIADIEIVTDYLGNAFPEKDNSALKKVHIAPLFVVALTAVEQDIDAEAFGKWAENFLRRQSSITAYGFSAMIGSSSKMAVNARIREMKQDLQRYLKAPKQMEMMA